MIGEGFKTAMRVLDKGRLTMGACALGAAQKLLELCVAYAKERIQFGKPIGRFQSVQNMSAVMATEILCRETDALSRRMVQRPGEEGD